jgi:hypothetical protein
LLSQGDMEEGDEGSNGNGNGNGHGKKYNSNK